MALTSCRECRRQVSTEASTCPHCGVADPAGAAAAAKERSAKTTRNGCLGCLGVIVLLWAIGYIVPVGGDDFSPTADLSSHLDAAAGTSPVSKHASPPISARQTERPAASSASSRNVLEERVKTIRSLKSGDCTPPEKWVRNRLQKNPEWPDVIIAATTCNRVGIGMTREQAIAGWGRPQDINRSTYSFGVHEQWVYGKYGERGYLYFEDGILTAMQN